MADALSIQVTNRLSAAKLVQLTNPDVAGATTADSARLDLAAADAKADLLTWALLPYSDSEPRIVSVCVDLVLFKLEMRTVGMSPEMMTSIKTLLREELKQLGFAVGGVRTDAER